MTACNKTDMALEWLEGAQDDLYLTKLAICNAERPMFSLACYHSQQAAEKALKAFLTAHLTAPPPYIHDLRTLCGDCITFDTSFATIIKDCAELTPYNGARYPGTPRLSEAEANIALEKATKIVKFCHNLLVPAPLFANQPSAEPRP
jgi:HEPN domain-containing protein